MSGLPALFVAACAPGDAAPPEVEFVESHGAVGSTTLTLPGAAGGVAVLPMDPGTATAGDGFASGAAGAPADPPPSDVNTTTTDPAAQPPMDTPPASTDTGSQVTDPNAVPDTGTGDAVPPPDTTTTETPVATGPKPTKLVVNFTTTSIGGKYGPVNVGAAWIEDASGKWVHTLEYWTGFLNVGHLTNYVPAVNQGAPSPGLFNFPAPVDTIGGATLQLHKSHSLSWGLKNAAGAEVPDGMYKLKIEMTEAEDPGETITIDIEKGAAPMSLMPPDATGFSSMSISLE